MASKHNKKKKSLTPHQVDRLLAFLREEDKPLRATVLAKVLGYSTAKDVNPTLNDLAKQGLVAMVTINSMPMWKVGSGVPLVEFTNNAKETNTVEDSNYVPVYSEVASNNTGQSPKMNSSHTNQVKAAGGSAEVCNVQLTPVTKEISQPSPSQPTVSPVNAVPSSAMVAPGILRITPSQVSSASSDSPFSKSPHFHNSGSYSEPRKSTAGTINYTEQKRSSSYSEVHSQNHGNVNDRTSNHSYGHGNHVGNHGNSYTNNPSYQTNTSFQNNSNFSTSSTYPNNRSQHMNMTSGGNSFGDRSQQNYNPTDRPTHHINGTYHPSRQVTAYGQTQQQMPHTNNYTLHQPVSHRANHGSTHSHVVQPQQQPQQQQAAYQQQQVTSSYMLPQQPQHPHAAMTTTYMMTDQHQQRTGAYPDMSTNRYNQSVNNYVSGTQVESAPMQQHQHTHNYTHQPQLSIPAKPESYSTYHSVTDNKFISNMHGHGALSMSSYGQPAAVDDMTGNYNNSMLNYSQPVANSGDYGFVSNYPQSVTGNTYMGGGHGGDFNHQVATQPHSNSNLANSFQVSDKYGYGPGNTAMGTSQNMGTFSCNTTTAMGLTTMPGNTIVNNAKGQSNTLMNEFRNTPVVQNSSFKPHAQPFRPSSHTPRDAIVGGSSCSVTLGATTAPSAPHMVYSQPKTVPNQSGVQPHSGPSLNTSSQGGSRSPHTSPSYGRSENSTVPPSTTIPKTVSQTSAQANPQTTVTREIQSKGNDTFMMNSISSPKATVTTALASDSFHNSGSGAASKCESPAVAAGTCAKAETTPSVTTSTVVAASQTSSAITSFSTTSTTTSSSSGSTHSSKQTFRSSGSGRSQPCRTNYHRNPRGNASNGGPAFGTVSAPYGVGQSYRFSSPWTLNGMSTNFAAVNISDKNGPFYRSYNKKPYNSGKNGSLSLCKHRSLLMDQLNPNEMLLAYLSLQCHILDPATVFTIHSQRTRTDACRMLLDILERIFRKDVLKCLCDGLTMSGQAYLAKAVQFAESKYRQDDTKRKSNGAKNKVSESSAMKNGNPDLLGEKGNFHKKDGKDKSSDKNGSKVIAQDDKEAKMSMKFLKAIDVSRQEILSSMIPDDDFLRHLVEKKSLNENEQHRIRIMTSRQDKIEALLSWLPKQEDSAFEAFCGALVQAHQPYLAHQLVREIKSVV